MFDPDRKRKMEEEAEEIPRDPDAISFMDDYDGESLTE